MENVKNPIRTVGLIGLGAVGVLYAERMQASGAELLVIADEARAARYREEGIFCNGRRIDFHYVTPDEARPVDLLLFVTKEGGLRAAMETAAGFVGPDTLIMCLTNGVTSEATLSERFGAKNVLYSIAQGMDAVKVGNALTYEHPGMIVVGEREPGPLTSRVRAVADYLAAHGVQVFAAEDTVRRQWSKWMLNIGVNQAVMVFEGTYETVQREGRPREVMIGAMREAQKLAALEGYAISEKECEDWIVLVDGLSPSGSPSMRQDGAAHRKSEVELFAGTAVRLGEKHGVDVPINRWLYDTVLRMEAAY